MAYRGGPILGEDDFLKHLPLSLDSRQRLLLEGLVHVADSIAAAYTHIHTAALRCVDADGHLSPLERAMIFNCAWCIVDDFYAARQLLGQLQPNAVPRPGGFYETATDFVLLRNRMDHLAQNVGNLTNARGIRRPIFGSISFFHISENDIEIENNRIRIISGRSYNISSGSISNQDVLTFAVPAGEEIAPPIDKLRFSAFDRDIELQAAIEKFKNLIHSISADVKELCRDNIRRQLGDGVELDQALNQVSPFGITMILDVLFPQENNY